ncbi:uncharacterized protein HKW66_Vig0250980 [Vigna angularis]|uniref:Xylanase inhibitor N-terminal domain-containing protein n=1 Tax=Phaseolus angularis TaxID=3914 RepID=A0A8T0KV61_PHAAN|nr:uncharacterized protein HKW66_Vig0250980 [Vigna angularis]
MSRHFFSNLNQYFRLFSLPLPPSPNFSSYHCYDSPCRFVPHPTPTHCNNCTKLHTLGRYEYSYVDGSSTTGFFSKETTTFKTSSNKQGKIENLAFGCEFKTSNPSVTGSSFNGAQGVMGLGDGPISFISQLGRKFCKCILDINNRAATMLCRFLLLSSLKILKITKQKDQSQKNKS